MSTTKRPAEDGDAEVGANGDGPTDVKRPNRPVPDDENVVDLITGDLNNIEEWIEENEQFFEPPVCNKLMHEDGQMKVFFVGGPNQRKDYHIEEGEELFYMLKGDMCLKVIEKGKHRNIEIKEGQIFLLPSRIAHSPQRKEGTMGMVIERERLTDEQDGLQYFIEKDGELSTDTLYEKWFHCDDLGPQLAAIIKEYFTTEQSKTGQPVEGTISENPPIKLDEEITINDPINLREWIEEHRETIENEGSVTMYGKGSQMEVVIYGEGDFSGQRDGVETFLWQIEGACDLSIDEAEPWSLEDNDTMLVKAGAGFAACNAEDSLTLVCYQDPAKKKK